MNVYTLTDYNVADFDDFKYSDNDLKRDFTEDFLKDARAYKRDADKFDRHMKVALWFSNIAILFTFLLQVLDLIPLWIPGWYFAFLFHAEAGGRIPQFSARLHHFMSSLKAVPGTQDDFGKSDQIMGTTFVVWLVGGFLTGEWEVFAIGTSICAFFGFSFVAYEYKKLLDKNRKAYKTCGELLLKELRQAK